MDPSRDSLPDNIEVLKAALITERAEAERVAAELAVAKAKASADQALIAHQRLQIEKLKRQLYGSRSERASRLLDQAELQFEELESAATEDEIAAEMAVAKIRWWRDLRASGRTAIFTGPCCAPRAVRAFLVKAQDALSVAPVSRA